MTPRRVGRSLARSCFAFAVLCGVVALGGAGTQGCGGDDSNGANPNNGNADGGVGIVAQNVSAYVGAVANVDASQSTRPAGSDPLAFVWTMTAQPPTSKLSTTDIQGATTETPSITPDVAGTYTLHAVATTAGVTGSADVTVTGVNGDVYYVQVNTSDLPPTAQIQTVQMDGTNGHALNCKRQILPANVLNVASDAGVDASSLGTFSPGADAGIFGYSLAFAFTAMMGPIVDGTLDTWESPTAGQPSRVAFGDFVSALAAGDAGTIGLVAATTDNTCATPPHPLHLVTVQGDAPNVWQPRFSPDGSRIAFVEDRGSADGGTNSSFEFIETVGFDGANAHSLASYCPNSSDSCWGDHFLPRRPQWADATHVAWIRSTGSNTTAHPITWELVSASDDDNSAPARLMACTSYGVPYSFGFVSGGNIPPGAILANYQASATSAEDLVILAADPSGQCQVVSNLTNLPGGTKDSYARDFAISPDGKTAAFMMHSKDRADAGSVAVSDGGPQLNLNLAASGGGDIWLVPIDGSKPAGPLNASSIAAYYGPRFIAAGSHLVWNGQGPMNPLLAADLAEAGILDSGKLADAGIDQNAISFYLLGSPAMVVAPVTGGEVTYVATTDFANGTYPMGGGNGGGCQCTPECTLQCPSLQCPSSGSSCDVAARKHPELPLLTTAGIFGVLMWRRRTRPDERKKDKRKSDDTNDKTS